MQWICFDSPVEALNHSVFLRVIQRSMDRIRSDDASQLGKEARLELGILVGGEGERRTQYADPVIEEYLGDRDCLLIRKWNGCGQLEKRSTMVRQYCDPECSGSLMISSWARILGGEILDGKWVSARDAVEDVGLGHQA